MGGGGSEVQEGGDICIFMVNSHCCMAEANTTSQSSYHPIIKKRTIRVHYEQIYVRALENLNERHISRKIELIKNERRWQNQGIMYNCLKS